MAKKFWVKKQIKSGKGNPDASNLKAELDQLVSRCEKAVNLVIVEGKPLTKKKIETELFTKKIQQGSGIPLIAYFRDVKQREYTAGNIGDSTSGHYEWVISKIEDFDVAITLGNVDTKWVEDFENHLRVVLGLSHNSVTLMLNYLHKVLLFAIKKDKILVEDPYDGYEHKRIRDGKKEFLTFRELNKLHEIFLSGELLAHKKVEGHNGKSMHRALQQFLVGCYTGLRYSDVVRLQMTDFYDSVLRVRMHKTRRYDKWVSIPITDPLTEILKLNDEERTGGLFLVQPYSNGFCNRLIKATLKYAGIRKNMGFHGARHTLACVALELGMSLEVVSDILGHSTLKQTKTYAKIQNQRVKDEMSAFNAISNSFGQQRPTKLRKVS